MGSELKPKPCPFCGGEGVLVRVRAKVAVECRGCGGQTAMWGRIDGHPEIPAIAAWNRRSEPRGDDRGSGLRPLALAEPNSGATADTSSAAGAWVTVPREPVIDMIQAGEAEGARLMEAPEAEGGPSPDDVCRCGSPSGWWPGSARIYRAMIASAPKAEVEGWRDIASAKRDGSPVLLWYPGLPTNELQIGQWRSYASEWGDLGDWIDPESGDVIETVGGPVEPTHWRPLPAPPPTRDGADEPVEGEGG